VTERIAVIDLGSNSARLIVMHIYTNGAYNLVYHQKETLRLGEGMSGNGLMREDAMQRAVETAKIFLHMCQLMKADKIMAVATAAVRSAKNGPAFLERIRLETGLPLQTISGRDEAHLGYIAVINTLDITDALLFDLGGGSTELSLITNRRVQHTTSLPFGAVILTEKFGTQNRVNEEQVAELRNFIMKQFRKIPWLPDLALPLVGVGGTVRNIAKMEQKRKNYPFHKVHNYRLGHISINDLWQSLLASDLRQRQKFPGLSSERADIIIAGTTVVKCLFDITGANRLITSGCGVREGLFLQHYFTHTGQPEIITDVLMHSVHNMQLFCKADLSHAGHVSDLASALFGGLQELHQLDERDKVLLRVASLLHDIGITINYYDHARHSAYLVENARLFGLTHREQMLAAVVAGWHHGPSAKYVRNKLYSEFLDEADWLKARKMALLLALAEGLDATQLHLATIISISSTAKETCLTVSIDEQQSIIEYQAIDKHRKWFRREFGRELLVRQHRLPEKVAERWFLASTGQPV
jgi:exopolyphosphatase / guanosine-5'-triphosphate,3'-diphosphate pyrophosphatase